VLPVFFKTKWKNSLLEKEPGHRSNAFFRYEHATQNQTEQVSRVLCAPPSMSSDFNSEPVFEINVIPNEGFEVSDEELGNVDLNMISNSDCAVQQTSMNDSV
jgi:hypothetical protein